MANTYYNSSFDAETIEKAIGVAAMIANLIDSTSNAGAYIGIGNVKNIVAKSGGSGSSYDNEDMDEILDRIDAVEAKTNGNYTLASLYSSLLALQSQVSGSGTNTLAYKVGVIENNIGNNSINSIADRISSLETTVSGLTDGDEVSY